MSSNTSSTTTTDTAWGSHCGAMDLMVECITESKKGWHLGIVLVGIFFHQGSRRYGWTGWCHLGDADELF